MPIQLQPYTIENLCHGATWTIHDAELLAQYVAWLALGYHIHIAKILEGEQHKSPKMVVNAAQAALKHLSPPASDGLRWHRDGWVFQLISWLAAKQSTDSLVILRRPQMQPAEKGQDGLIVHLNDSVSGLRGITICEDKATDNSRDEVRDKVWPEFAAYERGERDNELMAEVSTILAAKGVEQAEDIVADVFWNKHQQYRVCVTVKPAVSHALLFKGYDMVVSGNISRRRAETVAFSDMRTWMDNFCKSVSDEIKTLLEAADV
ncbi:MAG: hypothetical protein ABFD54_12990 [Armatimonadota bacterium]|nr:hypothetical protein [bacterium]